MPWPGAIRHLWAVFCQVRVPVRVSSVTALALVVVIAALGALTYWHHQTDARLTARVLDAQRMSTLYTGASEAAERGGILISLGVASPDSGALEQQAKVHAELDSALAAIAASPDPRDRRFGGWAGAYIVPIIEIFARLRENPAPPIEELTAQYARAYAALYASLVNGGLGETSLASQLVDPETVAGDPALLPNPVTIVMRHMAREKETAAAAAIVAREREEAVALWLSLGLYGSGVLLVAVLLLLTLAFGRREARVAAENDQLRRLSTTDPVTNLGNRRAFEEAVGRLQGRGGMAPVTLLMLDLDEFKTVNDTFGHARGDAVLSRFARMLSDMAPPGAGRFRIGGDEFAILAHGMDAAAAFDLAERIRGSTAGSLQEGVTVSAGVAPLDARRPDTSLMVEQADAALYEAKLCGRNVVVLYEERQASGPLFPEVKRKALRRLLREGRTSAVFQPIWRIDGSSLLGYEGLTRLHPDYGILGPEQAFELAEHIGHSAELDRLFRRTVLAGARSLPCNATVFLNLSPYSLTHHHFSPGELTNEITALGIEPARVVLEITERSLVPHEVVAEAIAGLRAHGFMVALDDVGAGNNGLQLLRRSRVDFIKVDQEVTMAAATGDRDRGALMAILAFASESGTTVIAEGIEDTAMFDLVRTLSTATALRGNPGLIHAVQGYLFGSPGPPGAAAGRVDGLAA